MTTNIDWSARGISWSEEIVREQPGEHATDRRTLGTAQICVVTDLPKFTAEYGEACVLSIMDGTSVRVMSQDVSRTGLRKRLSADDIRARVDARLRGMRNRPTASTVTVTRYPLPGGTFYIGTDVTEYRAAYTAALVDAGTPADVALTVAGTMSI